MSEHNHITRDIKPPGVCPGCDIYWGKARFMLEAINEHGECVCFCHEVAGLGGVHDIKLHQGTCVCNGGQGLTTL